MGQELLLLSFASGEKLQYISHRITLLYFILFILLCRVSSLIPGAPVQQLSSSSDLRSDSLLYQLYSTGAEAALGEHNVLLSLSKPACRTFVECVEQNLLQVTESAGAAAGAGRAGGWRLSSLILSAHAEPSVQSDTVAVEKEKERAEVLQVVNALSLSCLAATLLRMNQQQCDFGAGAGAGDVAVLLRCALLRAQELLLECEAALFSVTDVDIDSRDNTNTRSLLLLVESVRELQRCAALFCSTCCVLALFDKVTCAEDQQQDPQQAWHSLWAQPQVSAVPPLVHSSGADTFVSTESVPVPVYEPAAAVYELKCDLAYTQHCRRAWSRSQSSSLHSCSQVVAALVLDRAVAVHTQLLLRLGNKETVHK